MPKEFRSYPLTMIMFFPPVEIDCAGFMRKLQWRLDQEFCKRMCGIAGIWNVDGRPIEITELKQFTQALAHRGPDDEDFYIDGPLGFGHRRLAIIDPSSAGKQPMPYEDGRFVITYNGEIYNFLELRVELEALGHRFKSQSDTEVLLAAFAQWGAECQYRFNGMWAFAIWDSLERKLFLSRDRFGVKPLHYSTAGGRFAFASELKAFLHLRDFETYFDQDVIIDSLHNVLDLECFETTFLKDVKRLNAGHCLWVERGQKLTLHRWWKTLDHLPGVPKGYNEQVEEFRSLFFDVCRLRMRSDRRVGTTLSGGLDSSSVLCAISNLNSRHSTSTDRAALLQLAIHTQFPGSGINELEFATEAAQMAGATLQRLSISAFDMVSHIEDLVFAQEAIAFAPSPRWPTYRELQRSGVPVTLDGDGADELLAGYPARLPRAIQMALRPLPGIRRIHEYFKVLSASSYQRPGSRTRSLARIILNGYKRTSHVNPEQQPRNWLERAPRQSICPSLQEDLPLLSRMSPLNRVLYEDFHYFFLPAILRSVDRLSMAHGVEVRSPFLDWRLVTLCFSLPETSKLANGIAKRILRSAMNGILPATIEQRTNKIAFQPPLRYWAKDPVMQNFLLDTVGSKDFLDSDIWNGRTIGADVEAAIKRNDFSRVAASWPFIHAAILMRMFQKKPHMENCLPLGIS